jgi:hypothetical protein
MAKTVISPEQLRPADENTVAAAQERFAVFFFVASVCIVLTIISMLLPALHTFWVGNRLWAIGSSLVCISVLHSRFFDIRRRAAPFNQRIDETSLMPLWRVLERVTSHLWLIGFGFIGVSRWVHY